MITKSSKQLPKLRFPQFNQEWKKERLSDIVNLSKGRLLSKNDLSTEGSPCILYGELYTKYNEVIYDVVSRTNVTDKKLVTGKRNDLIIPSSGESAIDIACAASLQVDEVFLGGDLNILRPKKTFDSSFLSYQLNHARKRELIRVAQGATIVHLYNDDLKSVTVLLPEVKEQQKISSFLSLIDRKIEQLEEKIIHLKLSKKGILQRIFSQDIRMKDEKGQTFPSWTEFSLKEILKERKEYSLKNQDFPHVTLSKEGIYEKNERYNRDFLVRTKDKKYKVTHLNDICYNPANLKFGVICRNDFGSAVFSPIYVTFEVKPNFDPIFMGLYLERWDFINRVRKFEEGTVYERMSVKVEDFLKYRSIFPSIAEQKKIAKFATVFEKKINIEQKKLEQFVILKKGLLQQLFA